MLEIVSDIQFSSAIYVRLEGLNAWQSWRQLQFIRFHAVGATQVDCLSANTTPIYAFEALQFPQRAPTKVRVWPILEVTCLEHELLSLSRIWSTIGAIRN